MSSKKIVNLYWVGPRQSDIENVKDIEFAGSITIFGNGKNNNHAYCAQPNVKRRNHNVQSDAENLFFYNMIKSIAESDPNARFYFYNPNCVNYIPRLDEFEQKFVCVNNRLLLSETNNKTEFARFAKVAESRVPKETLKYTDCDYNSLVNIFHCDPKTEHEFIFQAPISSGGNGTFIVRRDTAKYVINLLSKKDEYMVSVYCKNNVPVNIHAVIFDDRVLMLPGSIQIMKEDDYRILYRGADFIAYRGIESEVRSKFELLAADICEELRASGYRGVCGIDGILCDDKAYVLEVNNRFQASTGLINMAASKAKLSSVQKINYAAFTTGWDNSFFALSEMTVDYSNFFYTDNGTKFHSKHIFNVIREYLQKGRESSLHVVALEDAVDEHFYDSSDNTEPLAYLFRVVFDTNIVSVNAENSIWINENICEPDKTLWYDTLSRPLVDIYAQDNKKIKDHFLKLKIALLIQGSVIHPNAEKVFVELGGLRPATNNAIDIKITIDVAGKYTGRAEKYVIINTPIDIKFAEFSPFSILPMGADVNPDEMKGRLYYYGKELTVIGVYPTDSVAFINDGGEYKERTTSRGTPYSELAFLSTDRLRVHLTNKCIFKGDKNEPDVGCKFCNIRRSRGVFKMDDVKEVVREYCNNAGDIGLDHFLVGGQTAPESDKDKIAEIIQIIRDNAPFADIYAMVIPYSEETIKKMYNAGLNQLACNVEVFDDEKAYKYMPGKRNAERTKEVYLQRLKYATKLFGRDGSVRSMVIVGLESTDSLLKGIREFAAAGIQPILSIFRPLPETPMERLEAPPMQYLYEVYNEIGAICAEYSLQPGPACVNCQNNTLALPQWMDEKI